MLADAGYDSEGNHAYARDEYGVRTIIPPKHGRPTTKPAAGRYRRLMQTRFDSPTYRQRSQVETVMSMIKRRQGSHVKGRSYWSQQRDLRLMALTHNIMILWHNHLFYRATHVLRRKSLLRKVRETGVEPARDIDPTKPSRYPRATRPHSMKQLVLQDLDLLDTTVNATSKSHTCRA